MLIPRVDGLLKYACTRTSTRTSQYIHIYFINLGADSVYARTTDTCTEPKALIYSGVARRMAVALLFAVARQNARQRLYDDRSFGTKLISKNKNNNTT